MGGWHLLTVTIPGTHVQERLSEGHRKLPSMSITYGGHGVWRWKPLVMILFPRPCLICEVVLILFVLQTEITSKSTLGKSTDGQIRSLKELWRWAECKGSDLFPVSLLKARFPHFLQTSTTSQQLVKVNKVELKKKKRKRNKTRSRYAFLKAQLIFSCDLFFCFNQEVVAQQGSKQNWLMWSKCCYPTLLLKFFQTVIIWGKGEGL